MSRIEAVIFDWAGTTVDYGCFAPVQAFKDAFNNYGLEPTNDQITDVKPYVLETVAKLRELGIKIGSTTGYTDMMMEPVLKSAKEQGYQPDCWYSPDATNHFGRPYPYMIFKNMIELHISSVKNVIKVGDTISDIQEGVNAGVIVVGVIEGSSTLGLNEEEFNALTPKERNRAIERVKEAYLDAGADYVINNLSELIALIQEVELF